MQHREPTQKDSPVVVLTRERLKSSKKTSTSASVVRVPSVDRVHDKLRGLIMNGTYPPGTVLSQVELAELLGVSRTPLREAMRRLEAEGLIHCEQNRRARVIALDVEQLDVMFTERLLVEAMGIKVTVPLLTEQDLNDILAAGTALRAALEKSKPAAADQARSAFHAALIVGASAPLRASIAEQIEHCERQRRARVDLPNDTLPTYTAIASACIARDADQVTRLIVRFESRLATALLASVDCHYKARAISAAIQLLDPPRAD